jgi:hypothetical protein
LKRSKTFNQLTFVKEKNQSERFLYFMLSSCKIIVKFGNYSSEHLEKHITEFEPVISQIFGL